MSRNRRKARDFFMRAREPKKTHCVPAHLTGEEAEHVAIEAYERGWSNSRYVRWLVMLDKKRKEDGLNLMAKVSGIPRERFDLNDRSERNERLSK